MPKIAIGVNTAWNVVNFRSSLITALVDKGYDVLVVAPSDRYVPAVKALGCRFINIRMNSGSKNPLRDCILFIKLLWLFLRERPDLYLGFTVKPNIYGSFAAWCSNTKIINNIAGLGAVFSRRTVLTRVVELLYRLSLSRSVCVFFQNEDDKNLFLRKKLVRPEVVGILPGSGVDLEKFKPAPMPQAEKIIFILISRLLWEKGVGEFVEAARIVRAQNPDTEFKILGFLEVDNPSAIRREQIEAWVADGSVTYLGQSDDVHAHIIGSHCVVLPSFYGEGTPKVLLEAAASARPIITTKSVGCRNTVDEGENGYLATPRDKFDLAKKMMDFIALSEKERSRMGAKSRQKAEQEFDQQIVVSRYLEAVQAMFPSQGI